MLCSTQNLNRREVRQNQPNAWQIEFAEIPNCKLAKSLETFHSHLVLEIVFNELSAGEMSQMGTMEQLELLDQFHVQKSDLERLDGDKYGLIERDNKKLYRFRTRDWRIYFEVKDGAVIVHRVLHKGTLSDFLFRSKMPVAEDEALAQSKHFWKLIDEGRNAKRL
jgi:hypothetical protein